MFVTLFLDVRRKNALLLLLEGKTFTESSRVEWKKATFFFFRSAPREQDFQLGMGSENASLEALMKLECSKTLLDSIEDDEERGQHCSSLPLRHRGALTEARRNTGSTRFPRRIGGYTQFFAVAVPSRTQAVDFRVVSTCWPRYVT